MDKKLSNLGNDSVSASRIGNPFVSRQPIKKPFSAAVKMQTRLSCIVNTLAHGAAGHSNGHRSRW
jgi:hypothetical protein